MRHRLGHYCALRDCAIKTELRAAYIGATQRYSAAVARLKSSTEASTPADYVFAFAMADEIRIAADEALNRYRRHMAEHGCQRPESAQPRKKPPAARAG